MKAIRFTFRLLAAIIQIIMTLLLATGFVLIVVPGIFLRQIVNTPLLLTPRRVG